MELIPIKGFADYQINRIGQIYSKKTNSFLSPTVNKNSGFYQIGLWSKRKGRLTRLLHRLIAEAFIPNPDNKPCITHINGNKLDNRVENLRWDDRMQYIDPRRILPEVELDKEWVYYDKCSDRPDYYGCDFHVLQLLIKEHGVDGVIEMANDKYATKKKCIQQKLLRSLQRNKI